MCICRNCNEESGDDHFCPECEILGFHLCESCGKSITESKYCFDIEGLVCKECQNKYENIEI